MTLHSFTTQQRLECGNIISPCESWQLGDGKMVFADSGMNPISEGSVVVGIMMHDVRHCQMSKEEKKDRKVLLPEE
jgi:hypothetical protein